MKRILGVAVLVAAGAAFATEVDSGNVFGFVPVTGATGLKAVAVPVAGYGASADIAVAEILQTTGLAANDKLYTLGADGKYSEYTLNSDKAWVASRKVTVGAGGMTAAQGTPAAEATLKRGQAFWLDTAATKVYLMGQAATDDVEITPTTGWQMIGNPSMTAPLKISTLTGYSTGDFLAVGEKTYQFTASGVWKDRKTREAVTDADVIPVGGGAMLRKL